MNNINKSDNIKNLLCPVCNDEADIEAKIEDIKLYRCSNCNHCFTDVNSLNYFEGYDHQYYETNWSIYPNYPLFNFISNYINKFCPSGSVLDIGSGRGDFLAHLQKTNSKLSLTGIDLSSPPPSIDGICFIEGDFFDTAFSQTYDAIVVLAVIEHIADVQSFVKKIYQICKPNGYIFIMTMNDQSYLYKIARMLKGIGLSNPFERLYSRHHLNHFNTASLKRLLVDQEFFIVDLHHHNTSIRSIDTGLQSAAVDIWALVSD